MKLTDKRMKRINSTLAKEFNKYEDNEDKVLILWNMMRIMGSVAEELLSTCPPDGCCFEELSKMTEFWKTCQKEST